MEFDKQIIFYMASSCDFLDSFLRHVPVVILQATPKVLSKCTTYSINMHVVGFLKQPQMYIQVVQNVHLIWLNR
jgi:hypothetical protein